MEQRAVMVQQPIDGNVIEACQQGDRDAFQLLFETYKDKVFSIAVYAVGGDRSVADDVTQQIFLKLFTAIRQFRGDSEFTTWLYRLVVNACIDERRRRKRWLPWGETVAMKNTGERKPQEKQFARLEVAEAVREAIAELKPKFRLPILLKYIEGLSYEEIASVMNCSKGTVASRLNRGHSQLAKRLAHLNNASTWND
ncbi:MAG TPA: sigma-70 family RNA polymerase sigma factor [Pyrinomonadaceae bacterium]|jgi:RNA polymerase sigma-70 factor (ECF subfamily)|nr:sigma-70 family RNA polymerase sigma factor [Pyrinomonadaceae bacterium]